VEVEGSLSKGDLDLFPQLSGHLSEVNLGLPFEEDEALDVTDNDDDLLSYLSSNRDKTSSVGSMSPRDTLDVFEDTERVAPPVVGTAKPPGMRVVRIVRLPGKNGVVKLVDNVEATRIEEAKSECQSMSKNAIAARENRQKKKHYVQGLECSVEKLRVENCGLKKENDKMTRSIESLRTEVRYLKSVLANQSTLSGLLNNIGSTPGVRFKASLCADADDEEETEVIDKQPAKRFCRKRKFANEDREQARKENVAHNLRLVESMSQPKKSKDHSYLPDNTANSSSDSEDDEVGGVCLHVNRRNVSIEFCSSCSSKASGKPAEKNQVR